MARNRSTLLEMTQRVLDAMNHDNVNSISDTIESTQIAKEARTVYYELMDRDDWPHLLQAIPLESVSDTSKPNFLKIPEEVTRIDVIRYETTQSTDTARSFDVIEYLKPNEFLEHVLQNRSDQDNVTTVTNSNNVPMFIRNDTRPYYWTTFDDEYIIFDAYDSAVDDTMQASKSIVQGKVIPTWTHSDSFVPDLPDHMFSLMLAELTAAAFTYWKQGASVKDEARAARHISRLRKDAEKTNEKDNQVHYGRPKRYLGRSADGVKGSIRASGFGSFKWY